MHNSVNSSSFSVIRLFVIYCKKKILLHFIEFVLKYEDVTPECPCMDGYDLNDGVGGLTWIE